MEKQLNLDDIIQFKFDIEREVESLNNNFAKYFSNIQLFKNSNKLFINQYKLNIKMFGEEYLKQQIILLKEVDKYLYENCEHNWINDTIDEPLYSRNICYCGKCYLYKSKTIE